MSFFDYIRNKLFPESGTAKLPFVHEVLERRSSEKADYAEWKKGNTCSQLLQFICNQYKLSKKDLEDQNMMRILSTRSSYGFMLRYPENIPQLQFQHLFDLLKEKFLKNGYRIYASDRKIYTREDHIEIIERHYLKPKYKDKKPPLNQIFGNISIELYKFDDLPTHIKFLCNNYYDSKYTVPLSFDDLMDVICTVED